MLSQNLSITKGAIYAYRLYDIAHEINLLGAKSLLDRKDSSNMVSRYKLRKDPLKSINFKEPPLILSERPDRLSFEVNGKKVELDYHLEIKIWNYGVLSLSYRIELNPDTSWRDLIEIGSVLDNNSIIDTMACDKRDEISKIIALSLKKPFTHPLFEDYTTYLIEEINVLEKDKENNLKKKKIKNPLDILKTTGIAELLLAEPNKTLSESTHKTIQSNYSQYTKHDLLIMDWNSALVMDLGEEKEYQDYVDILEFSLAQLLELRIYDELLDEKLDELYDSLEDKQYNKITDLYSKISEESNHLHMEFSDFFEKLDNSIKTVGDFYLAKILKSADKRFGFDELKKTMSRKIQTLSNISKMCQDKVDSMVDTQRNATSHRLELVVILLISVEVIPVIYQKAPIVWSFISKFLTGLF